MNSFSIIPNSQVDLGLSVKWATCNVGAKSPEEYGDFYTFDEAIEKAEGNLPTKEQWEELKNKCTWKWTTQNGVNGYKVTGPNGNSIFLPAAGDRDNEGYVDGVGISGYYWSSTPYDTGYAWNFCFVWWKVGDTDHYFRCYGHSVRLVRN